MNPYTQVTTQVAYTCAHVADYIDMCKVVLGRWFEFSHPPKWPYGDISAYMDKCYALDMKCSSRKFMCLSTWSPDAGVA